MRLYLLLILMAVTGEPIFSQTALPIEYKGGSWALFRKVVKYLEINNGVYNGNEPEKERQGNKYFIVVLSMDGNGRFNNDCSILSIQDTTNCKNVLAAVKETNGSWINHTGENQTVIIPVYFLYDSDEKKLEKDPSFKNYFYSERKRGVICLEPIVIKLLPTVSNVDIERFIMKEMIVIPAAPTTPGVW